MMLLVSIALAEPSAEIDCAEAWIAATLPAGSATSVPVDVVPVAVIVDGGCGGGAWTAALYDAETVEEVDSAEVAEGEALVGVAPSAPLSPFTDYIFSLNPTNDYGYVTEVAFQTGDEVAAPLDGVPTLLDAGASWFESSGQLSLSARIRPAATTDGASLVTLHVDPDLVGIQVAVGGSPFNLFGSTTTEEPSGEVCLVARQRDYAGNEVESEPSCGEPEIVEETCGCAVGVGVLGWVPIWVAAMLARRRA